MSQAVLKLCCVDQRGIAYDVSRVIFENGGNVLDSQQHREELDNQFFMYVKFDLAAMSCTRKELLDGMAAIATRYEMDWSLNFSDVKRRVAIMVSKYDHCLYDLMLRHRYGELDAEISLIVSNHPDLENVAEHFGTPYICIPRNKDNREEADQQALDLFKQHNIDLIVLARYMQIVTPVLLNAYPKQIINVHHGFLPAFKGAKPYHQAYEKGVKLIGASSHYATVDLDMGPLIEQATEKISHSFSVQDLIRCGRDIESKVLATAVKAHLDGKIIVYKNRTIVFD
ncbi:MAG: formyltetrahydrofolate deformylase [Lentisphaeraceae bacterium]|nr:formyltetrahydrofolate deformylase [Lentisphaeraceae bacterium]